MTDGQHPYVTAVLIVTPDGIPLVRDPKKPNPFWWKLPGGRSEGGETPIDCAIRETREETGIRLTAEQLQTVATVDKGNHQVWFFRADLPVTPVEDVKEEGNEGEEIAFYPPSDILTMPHLFPNHRAVIQPILEGLSRAGRQQ